jgi:cysteine synthase A
VAAPAPYVPINEYFATNIKKRPMDIKNGLADAIGNTPLLRLKKASEETGCEILGKAEFLNPGQSVKDRAALFIIRDALDKGTLKPGGVIVEGTAATHWVSEA